MAHTKDSFPDGTTWQQAYDAFDALATQEVPGAFDAVLTMEMVPHGGDVNMELEPALLAVFRQRYEALLMAAETM